MGPDNKVFLSPTVYDARYARLAGLAVHVVQVNFIGVFPTKKDFAENLVGTGGMDERRARQVAAKARVNDRFRTWSLLVSAGLVSVQDQGVYVADMNGFNVYRVLGDHRVCHVATYGALAGTHEYGYVPA